jgi:hAT family C-terminal dimerisation region
VTLKKLAQDPPTVWHLINNDNYYIFRATGASTTSLTVKIFRNNRINNPNDYRMFLNRQSRNTPVTNEFDNYISTPPPDKPMQTLSYWKAKSATSPHLGLMAWDTFAVPATGAGVERMFSKSGRVASGPVHVYKQPRFGRQCSIKIFLFEMETH